MTIGSAIASSILDYIAGACYWQGKYAVLTFFYFVQAVASSKQRRVFLVFLVCCDLNLRSNLAFVDLFGN